MRTLFINGSPKGEKGNTGKFIQTITGEMKSDVAVRVLKKGNVTKLAGEMAEYDNIIIAMPLYIHAMPALVKELFEAMPVNESRNKKLGFIVQAGFEESSTADYLLNYLELFCARVNYQYMGTAVKPGAAGLSLMPRFFFRKLFKQLEMFGREYDRTFSFTEEMKEMLGDPRVLSEKQVKLYSSKLVVWINTLGWHHYLKKNGAFEQRLEMPYKR